MTRSIQTPSELEPDSFRFAHAGVAAGDVIDGKYRVEAPIAEGGMGVVVRATHLGLGCAVALKVIRPEHLANEDVVERLLSEARIAASLHSRHVNRVLDVGRTAAGMPYLVLEYLTGCDLCSYLEQHGPLPMSEAVDYVMQACSALAEAHAIGIVHRDLKPENLFLSDDADAGLTLKVLDFGISKAPPSSTLRSVVTNPFEIIGSPTYMSPEQVQGSEVDARADIWALGALLHELCTGEVLFRAASMTETFEKILDEHYLPKRYGTDGSAQLLHRVVCRCLCRNPADRYCDVVELARQLAPLGTDGLQAARVARVAATSRARVVAATGDGASQTPGTPLAITRSHAAVAETSGGSQPFRRWMLLGVVASLPVIAGLGYLGRAERWSVVESSAPAPAADPPRPLSEPRQSNKPSQWRDSTELSEYAPPPPPATTSPLPSARKQLGAASQPMKWQARERRPVLPLHIPAAPTTVAAPLATWAPPAPPAPAAPSVVAPQENQVAPDAWDPKSFGGRR